MIAMASSDNNNSIMNQHALSTPLTEEKDKGEKLQQQKTQQQPQQQQRRLSSRTPRNDSFTASLKSLPENIPVDALDEEDDSSPSPLGASMNSFFSLGSTIGSGGEWLESASSSNTSSNANATAAPNGATYNGRRPPRRSSRHQNVKPDNTINTSSNNKAPPSSSSDIKMISSVPTVTSSNDRRESWQVNTDTDWEEMINNLNDSANSFLTQNSLYHVLDELEEEEEGTDRDNNEEEEDNEEADWTENNVDGSNRSGTGSFSKGESEHDISNASKMKRSLHDILFQEQGGGRAYGTGKAGDENDMHDGMESTSSSSAFEFSNQSLFSNNPQSSNKEASTATATLESNPSQTTTTTTALKVQPTRRRATTEFNPSSQTTTASLQQLQPTRNSNRISSRRGGLTKQASAKSFRRSIQNTLKLDDEYFSPSFRNSNNLSGSMTRGSGSIGIDLGIDLDLDSDDENYADRRKSDVSKGELEDVFGDLLLNE